MALRFPPRLAAKGRTKVVSRVLKRRPLISQVIRRQRLMGPAQGETPQASVEKKNTAKTAEPASRDSDLPL
jgi:hypothetical protein